MFRIIKNSILVFISIIIFCCCSSKTADKDIIDYKANMLEADRAFSKLSEQKGIKLALLEYIDSNGVLLRPNSHPIVGGEAINFISQGSDTSYILTWEPKGGSVAKSGDLGYTFGVYSRQQKNNSDVIYGTYVSVWKLQPDGKWKFALESGNEGIE